MYRSILLILLVDKKYLIIFPIDLRLNAIFCKTRFIYYLIVDDGAIKKINYVQHFSWGVNPTGYKYWILLVDLNNIFSLVYLAIVS